MASVILDLPPPDTTGTGNTQPTSPTVVVAAPLVLAQDTVRPPIEQLLDADTVRALLPRDAAGNIDWMAALRSGVINPRSRLPGDTSSPRPSSFEFAFDFFFPGPDTLLKAFFPHSAHTQWVDCAQCHPRIFPYRNTPVSMGEIFQGKFCGECHGKVAYPVLTGCERCHVNLNMPPNRAQPDLIGTITMQRIAAPVTDADSLSGGVFQTDALPVARFPHWVHRIRFRCKVCHMKIFEPRVGSNEITMKSIGDGEHCGNCHNGRTAFAAGFGNCQRCHVADAAGAGS
jgi:c(7)-type cytochrome triheme protein